MCNIVPYTLPCCHRVYVAVTRTRDCPPTWPAIKCPKELCFQIGIYPQERSTGTCWRCQAVRDGLTPEQREGRRPGIDKALVERFIETPDMKRRHQEDMGFCWFCGCKSGCQSCERWVDPDVERNLGKNKFWEEDEGGDLEMVEQPRKRARTTKTKGKGKEKVPATPRQARAKTRLQRKAGQASKGARTEATPKHVHQEYFAVPHYNQTTAGNSQPLLWHENPASYQTYQQSHSPYLSTQSEAGPSNYQANNYAQHQTYRRVPGDLYDSQAHVTPAAETPQTLFFGGYTNYQDTNHQQTEPDWTSLVDPALLYEYKAPKLPATPGRELYQSYSLANINDELGRTSRVDQAEDSFGVNCSYAVNIQALKEQSKEIRPSAEAFFEENQRSQARRPQRPESVPTSPKTVRAAKREPRALDA